MAARQRRAGGEGGDADEHEPGGLRDEQDPQEREATGLEAGEEIGGAPGEACAEGEGDRDHGGRPSPRPLEKHLGQAWHDLAMSDLERRSGSRPSRRKREQRAYNLVLAGGALGLVFVVGALLAIFGS